MINSWMCIAFYIKLFFKTISEKMRLCEGDLLKTTQQNFWNNKSGTECNIHSITLINLNETRKSVDGEPSHIPALIKANRIEASYFLAYVAKYG